MGGRNSVLKPKILRPVEEGTYAHDHRHWVLGAMRGAPVSFGLFSCNRKYPSPHCPNFLKMALFQDPSG